MRLTSKQWLFRIRVPRFARLWLQSLAAENQATSQITPVLYYPLSHITPPSHITPCPILPPSHITRPILLLFTVHVLHATNQGKQSKANESTQAAFKKKPNCPEWASNLKFPVYRQCSWRSTSKQLRGLVTNPGTGNVHVLVGKAMQLYLKSRWKMKSS